MKQLLSVFFVMFCLGLALGQTTDPDCTATGVDDVGVMDFVDRGGPSHVLYVQICHVQVPRQESSNDCYNMYMNKGGHSLANLFKNDPLYKNTGSTIRMVTLGPQGFTDAGYGSLVNGDLEWNKYTQVWVGDLSSGYDLTSKHMDGYRAIIKWYDDRGGPHIICDGRYLSSMWNHKGANYWKDSRPNHGLVRNYFANLRVRGGGLVLATDHATAFTVGINEINKGIGIDDFVNFFDTAPFLMEVDVQSSIWSYPDRGYWIKSELEGVGQPLSYYWPPPYVTSEMGFVFDDSSTSDAPFNLQPNGRILYPVSWHRGYLNERPGISSTISGKVGFLIGIQSPSCDDHFEGGDKITFTVEVLKGGEGGGVTYVWLSSIDGEFQETTSLTTFQKDANTFSPGEHVIICRAKDSQGLVAEARVRIRLVFLSGEPTCFSAGWNGGKVPQELFPIKQGGSAVEFYSYGNPISDAANTKLELPRIGQWFFYENQDGTVSLVGLFGSGATRSSTSRARAQITVSGYDTSSVKLQLMDPPFSPSNFIWTHATGKGTFTFEFGASTAGVVLGPFSKSEFCIKITFDKSYEDNVQFYYVRSHTVPNQDSQSVNPSKIVYFSSSAVNTEDITMCYGQCICPDTTLNALTNTFHNRGINFVLQTGILGHYTDIHECSWDIQPQTEHAVWGISIYFDDDIAFSEGDVLEIRHKNGTLLTSYTNGASPNAFHSDLDDLRVSFVPLNDGNTDIGFRATYWVLPQLNSVVPEKVPTTESTEILFHGHNFVNSRNLKCLIDGIERPATFVNADTVKCIAPPHAIGIVNVEVSNDGVRFTDTTGSPYPSVTLEYFDASCDELRECGSCLAQSCSFCNIDANDSYCFSGTDECESKGGTVETEACTSCYRMGSCDNFEGGTCNADDTCTCNEDRFNDPPDCSCKKCPVHPNGEYCGGTGGDRPIGECGCDGVCTCWPGFTGEDCSCLTCGGWNGKECGGVGDCQCDGNCSCHAGYTSLTEVRQICECSEICPTAVEGENCSGHGTCNCGVCECEPEWSLLEDCSCASSCPENCNGNGICGCDGQCICSPGFSGEYCGDRLPCEGDCSNCTSDQFRGCSWCPVDGSCVHPVDIRFSQCNPNQLTNICPSPIIQEVPPTDHTPTYIAIAVGGAIALVLGIVAAFIISRSKTESDLLNFGTDPFAAGNAVQESGIYKSNSIKGSSGIYQSNK